jgi:hypothetical protein
MNPELKEDSNLVNNEYDYRMKTHEGHREKKYELEMLHPTQAKGDCEVIILARMVPHVGGPEKPLAVRDGMSPIAAQVKNDVAGEKGPPIQFHSPTQSLGRIPFYAQFVIRKFYLPTTNFRIA